MNQLSAVDHPPLRQRRGLTREEAAFYIRVGTTKFDEMVKDGRMPKPRCIDRRRVWDIRELDMAFDNLPHEGEETSNPWDGATYGQARG